jgi:DNA replication ATP-dependent helicase Dna2
MKNQIDSPSPAGMAGFLHELRHLVWEEADAAREAVENLWSRPLPARVAEGRAIDGLRVESVSTDGTVELTCARNDSRFREGDLVLINRGDPCAEPRLLVTLDIDEDTHLVLSVAEPVAALPERLAGPGDWVLDEGYLDLSEYLFNALREAGATATGRERVLPLLMGHARPRVDVARYEHALVRGEAAGLNWSQCEAFAQAYATDLAYLIQGPPGTGKTRVIAHLARALAEEGERVLVSAFTHRAINNALNKLGALAPGLPVAKIGADSQMRDLDVEGFRTFHDSWFYELDGGYVIGATPFANQTRRLGGATFDTIIFDEASQITLPLAIMGMLAASKFIFVGDQKQLPPVLPTRDRSNPLHESVFAVLAARGFDTLLTESYRLNATLSEWPSRTFYDGQLVSHPSAAERRLLCQCPPRRLAHLIDPAQPLVFLDLAHENMTTRSVAEAEVVAELVVSLLECGVPAEEIGIVSPFRAQGRQIRNLLRSAVPDKETRQLIVTDTVERMQGQEREVVIISLTTSDPSFAASLAEFFFQPERLNVAITRPRSKLIIVGSRHVLSARPADPQLQETVRLLDELLGCCAYHTLER